MSTTISSRLDETSDPGSAGAERSEPVGRAKRRAGAARRELAPRAELAEEVKALLPDELIDELLAGARTEEEIAGPGGLLGQLTKRLGGGRVGGGAPDPAGGWANSRSGWWSVRWRSSSPTTSAMSPTRSRRAGRATRGTDRCR